MVHDPISVLDALMIALSGIVIVFLMLALLWGVIAVISRVMGVLEKHTAHPASVSAAAPASAAPAPAAAPAPKAAPAPAAAPAAAGGQTVEAPMPGKILDIKVKVGDAVGYGQCVIVMEAMKMETEIVAPAAGTVASINVSTGDSVETGAVLVTLN